MYSPSPAQRNFINWDYKFVIKALYVITKLNVQALNKTLICKANVHGISTFKNY